MSDDTRVDVPVGSDFPLANLPYGVFAPLGAPGRVGVAIGHLVVDLAAVLGDEVFAAPSLNASLALGP